MSEESLPPPDVAPPPVLPVQTPETVKTLAVVTEHCGPVNPGHCQNEEVDGA